MAEKTTTKKTIQAKTTPKKPLKTAKDPDMAFEISWEVCNKVGGIHTVLSSKAEHMTKKYKDGYFCIGPHEPNSASEFRQLEAPENFEKIFSELAQIGIKCRYGVWLIDSNPQAILIDTKDYENKAGEIKGKLWEYYGIDSLGTDFFDFDKPTLWAWCSGKVVEAIYRSYGIKKPNIVAHAHEWLAGTSILYLKKHAPEIRRVFTTHATVLGRALSERDFDTILDANTINPDKKAGELGLNAKHLTEKNSAINADCFTTVSEVTGDEAEEFLGKKPDIYTFNGLSNIAIADDKRIKEETLKGKTNMRELIAELLYPSGSIEVTNECKAKQPLMLSIFGRFEPHVKGLDFLTTALKELDAKLKNYVDKDIVCFYFIPSNAGCLKPEVEASISRFRKIKEIISDRKEELVSETTISIAAKECCIGKWFSEKVREIAKHACDEFTQPMPLTISTHQLYDEYNNPLIKLFREAGLDNSKERKIKVIFYPVYLKKDDDVLGISYDEALAGSDLGIFPSFYEPWGYTPLECLSKAVPAVTTNRAGFGRFITQKIGDKYIYKQGNSLEGVNIIDRIKFDYNQSSSHLADFLYDFIMLKEEEMQKLKKEAKYISKNASWDNFCENYFNAYKGF